MCAKWAGALWVVRIREASGCEPTVRRRSRRCDPRPRYSSWIARALLGARACKTVRRRRSICCSIVFIGHQNNKHQHKQQLGQPKQLAPGMRWVSAERQKLAQVGAQLGPPIE